MTDKIRGFMVLIATMFMLFSMMYFLIASEMHGEERVEAENTGMFYVIVGALISGSKILWLYAVVSVIAVFVGHPFLPPAIILIAWILIGGAGGGGGGEVREERKHYDIRTKYKGHSVRQGNKTMHYGELGKYKGYSIRQGNEIIDYDENDKPQGSTKIQPAGRKRRHGA